MMSCVRVGEASHPGPSQHHPFVIATCNPTGLLGKASHFKEMPDGVYGISESHLTTEGVVQFRRELQLHKVNAKYLMSRPSPRIRPAMGSSVGNAQGWASFLIIRVVIFQCNGQNRCIKLHAHMFQVFASRAHGLMLGFFMAMHTGQPMWPHSPKQINYYPW